MLQFLLRISDRPLANICDRHFGLNWSS